MLRNRSVFSQRTIITVIGIPLVIAFIWFGSPWFTFFAVAWGLGGAYEFYNIIRRSKGLAPLTYFGLLWVVLFIVSPHFADLPAKWNMVFTPSLLLAAAIILPLLILLWRKGKENAFANWVWTVAGILYIGWLLQYGVALRLTNSGMIWVFLAMLCTFASDTSAYLGGRAFGRHKMAPFISPNKTWEGAVFGVAGAVMISAVIITVFNLIVGQGWVTGLKVPSYGIGVALGVLISIVGQLGDLVKSVFKRNMAIKDSSHYIPGHGGFLDRMDSQAFAVVTVFYFVFFMTTFGYL